MYVPLGSHDTERALTRLHGDETRLRLAWLCQFAYPGAPAIYYGDEIGLPGGKDPECRRAFPWDESKWNQGLRDYLKKLIAARKRLPALRRGAYRHLAAESHGQCLAFARLHGEESILVALNMGATHCRLTCARWRVGLAGRPLRSQPARHRRVRRCRRRPRHRPAPAQRRLDRALRDSDPAMGCGGSLAGARRNLVL